MNPFGVPISVETLEQMKRYKGKTITREDLAREAMRLIHAEDKNLSAISHALKLKADYGDGVSTLCLFYNASGGKLELVAKQDWSGSVYKEEPPQSFENGQWLAFLHTHTTASQDGSQAARVYRGLNALGTEYRDFMVAWNTRFTPAANNAYTEVREEGHFPQHWGYINGLLENAKKMTRDESDPFCSSVVSIGGYTTSECIAVFKSKFSQLPED